MWDHRGTEGVPFGRHRALPPRLRSPNLPFLIFGLLPLLSLWALNARGLAIWALLAWGAIAIVLIVLVAWALPPQQFRPKTTLSSELAGLIGLVRGGMGLFVAAVVGAIGAIAVQRDLTPETSGRGEIVALLTIFGEVLVVIVAVRLLYGIAFRFQVAAPRSRVRAAHRQLAYGVTAIHGAPHLRVALRNAIFVHWRGVFAEPAVYWVAATVGSLAALVGISLLIEWASK